MMQLGNQRVAPGRLKQAGRRTRATNAAAKALTHQIEVPRISALTAATAKASRALTSKNISQQPIDRYRAEAKELCTVPMLGSIGDQKCRHPEDTTTTRSVSPCWSSAPKPERSNEMAKRGPHPKHPCPKCSGRMILETVGGRSYLECQNVDCGGRVLLDQKAPSDTPDQIPAPVLPVRRGRRPHGTPMSEEARRKIGDAMRAAHAKRKGLLPFSPRIKPTHPTSRSSTGQATTVHLDTAIMIDRTHAIALTASPRVADVRVNLLPSPRPIEAIAIIVEALTQEIETIREQIEILTRTQSTLRTLSPA